MITPLRSLLPSSFAPQVLLAVALLVLTAGCGRALISEPVDESGGAAEAPVGQEDGDTEGDSEDDAEAGEDADADDGDDASDDDGADGDDTASDENDRDDAGDGSDEDGGDADDASSGGGDEDGGGSAGSSGVGDIGDGTPEDPMRVLFEPGTDRIGITGTVGDDEQQTYVIGASAGQRMDVAVSQPGDEISISFTVDAPDGTQLAETTESWSGTLEVDGDYVVTLGSILTLGDKDYTLDVSIGDSMASGHDDDAGGDGAGSGASDAMDAGWKTTRQMRQLGEVTFHFTTVPGKGGETKVIDVSGPNGFFQRIVPPDYPEPMGGPDDALFLAVEDMDFDETDDFRVMQMIPAGAYFPYYYWLWQPGLDQFAYHEPYEPLLSPVFEDGRVKSPWRAGAAQWGEDTFIVFEDVPELERKEQWDVELDTPDGMARHRVWEYDFANGTEELVVDEMVPHS